ncbi:MAG TPA: cAMP-binding protein [Oscillatoriales bacterium UBA8482]|nr:cAMP-binding protein [Oscillatoriales bacterium UBA8482]
MAAGQAPSADEAELAKLLIQSSYLFRDLEINWLAQYLPVDLAIEKLYSSRPVYTAFRPNIFLDVLYIIISGGPIITRSTPLDRIIAISYPGGCFGMRNLPFGFGQMSRAFPSLVEAYKTTDVIKLPLDTLKEIYQDSPVVQERYDKFFELREKFQYHLLNCSSYPPQAVAALFRALVYQERSLGNQPQSDGVYTFDLPIDVIARACQLNHRTVEQVLKGMQKVKLIEAAKSSDSSEDTIRVIDPEGLKETYSATRDKVSWWPLK